MWKPVTFVSIILKHPHTPATNPLPSTSKFPLPKINIDLWKAIIRKNPNSNRFFPTNPFLPKMEISLFHHVYCTAERIYPSVNFNPRGGSTSSTKKKLDSKFEHSPRRRTLNSEKDTSY